MEEMFLYVWVQIALGRGAGEGPGGFGGREGGRGKAGFRFKSHMMAFSSGWLDQSVMHGRNMIRDEASCSFSMSIAAITRAL